MNDLPHPALEEYKTQASILIKQLRSDNTHMALEAAKRFVQLPYFADISAIDLITSEPVKLKHALHVLALEHGFDSWADFKHQLERDDRFKAYKASRNPYTLLYPQRCVRFTNEWHSDYAIASSALGHDGGYLLPYKNQFFICGRAYIEQLGLDPDDPDWERIGYNWVKPADEGAWQRLDSKLRQLSTQLQGGQ